MNGASKHVPDELSTSSESSVLRVTGRVPRPVAFGMKELRAMEIESFDDLFVVCGDGDPKGRIGSCSGVLLENIIRRADVLKEEHDDTKKMFLVASARDGYKVVFSWQEVFNTEVGGGVMVILEKDGRPLDALRERFDLISAQDFHMGSRYVKDVNNIEVVLVR